MTQRWCSDSAELVLVEDAPVLKVAERLDPEFWREAVTFATINYAREGEEHTGQIAIYKNRVFWPCEVK